MVRFLVLFAVIAVVLTVYAVIDCAMTDARRSRALAKPAWLLVIIIVPVIGPLMWLVFGKIRGETLTRETAPDDDDDFLRSIGIATEVDSRSDAERRAESRRASSERDGDAEEPAAEESDDDAEGEAGADPHEASSETPRDDRSAADDDSAGPGADRGDDRPGRADDGPRSLREDGPAAHDAAPRLPGDDSQAPRV